MATFRATSVAVLAVTCCCSAVLVDGFSGSLPISSRAVVSPRTTTLSRSSSSIPPSMGRKDDDDDGNRGDRRAFLADSVLSLAGLAAAAIVVDPSPASAKVYLDPAMYGDQELRASAVDSLRESVRRALLQKPSLTPYVLELALLDSLS